MLAKICFLECGLEWRMMFCQDGAIVPLTMVWCFRDSKKKGEGRSRSVAVVDLRGVPPYWISIDTHRYPWILTTNLGNRVNLAPHDHRIIHFGRWMLDDDEWVASHLHITLHFGHNTCCDSIVWVKKLVTMIFDFCLWGVVFSVAYDLLALSKVILRAYPYSNPKVNKHA